MATHYTSIQGLTRLSGVDIDELTEALEVAGIELYKANDPIEEARWGLTAEEAQEVAREDSGLLFALDDEDDRQIAPVELDPDDSEGYLPSELIALRLHHS